MLQHAIGVVADRRHGYCVDDNARALMLMNVASGLPPHERAQRSQTYAAFVQHAWSEDAGAFRNFMSFDRSWCEDRGSDDSNGRALWALGHTVENAPDPGLREWALRLYETALPHCSAMTSPRTIAFTMLGAAAVLRARPRHHASREALGAGADVLGRLLDASRRPDWAWFEAVLGYDNPRLCQALIESGLLLEDPVHAGAGIETLGWISARQRAAGGHFRPIGSESFGKAHTWLPFDQQPLEAQAAIDACRAAFAATRDSRWIDHATAAWEWFFDANDRGVVLGELQSGRCRDGINPRGANLNCGAESILAFQLSHYSLIALVDLGKRDSMGESVGGGRRLAEQSVANP